MDKFLFIYKKKEKKRAGTKAPLCPKYLLSVAVSKIGISKWSHIPTHIGSILSFIFLFNTYVVLYNSITYWPTLVETCKSIDLDKYITPSLNGAVAIR